MRRDHAATPPEATRRTKLTTDARDGSVSARRAAAADRRHAAQDRAAGASQRTHAELDRTTALADRGAGASERTYAELDRSTALADRGAGASQRTQAELDRTTALADRGEAARERDEAGFDELTGAHLRGPGLAALDRELARVTRTRQSLVLAFIDVDGLKGLNDAEGHAAGDRMLRDVANALRQTLRSYDLIIRFGGDEFVCAIAGVNIAEAARRFALVSASLADAPGRGAVSVGLADWQPGDSREELIARADADLYSERRQRRPAPPPTP